MYCHINVGWFILSGLYVLNHLNARDAHFEKKYHMYLRIYTMSVHLLNYIMLIRLVSIAYITCYDPFSLLICVFFLTVYLVKYKSTMLHAFWRIDPWILVTYVYILYKSSLYHGNVDMICEMTLYARIRYGDLEISKRLVLVLSNRIEHMRYIC